MQVAAVALVQTEALLCHDLKNTDLKIRFRGHSGYLFFPLLFEGICSQSIKDANMQLQKIFVLWFYDTRRHANILVVNFIVDIRPYLVQF